MAKFHGLNAFEVQYLRQSLCLTQEQVAELTKMSVEDVIGWENNETEISDPVQKQLLNIEEVIEMQVLNTCDGIEAMFKKEPKRRLAFVVYPDQALYTQYNPQFLSSLPVTELYTSAAWRIKNECKLILEVDVTLVPFDVESYKAFRAEKQLGESMENRAKWAAAQL